MPIPTNTPPSEAEQKYLMDENKRRTKLLKNPLKANKLTNDPGRRLSKQKEKWARAMEEQKEEKYGPHVGPNPQAQPTTFTLRAAKSHLGQSRLALSGRRLASPSKKSASPLRSSASPSKKSASPLRSPASPSKKSASPLRSPASPSKKSASPLRSSASPSKKSASPLRSSASPSKKSASPSKRLSPPPRPSRRLSPTPSPPPRPSRRLSSPPRPSRRLSPTPSPPPRPSRRVSPKYKIIVFDVDRTLTTIHQCGKPPLNSINDANYTDLIKRLKELSGSGIKMYVVTRCNINGVGSIKDTKDPYFINLKTAMGITEGIENERIFGADDAKVFLNQSKLNGKDWAFVKGKYIQRIMEKERLDKSEVLFIDDDNGNAEHVAKLGIDSVTKGETNGLLMTLEGLNNMGTLNDSNTKHCNFFKGVSYPTDEDINGQNLEVSPAKELGIVIAVDKKFN
jgi:hypothetical protein